MLKAVLFDLDGTVYEGSRAIKGVAQTIGKLEEKGLKIFFLSNASMRTREEIAQKLSGMGIRCSKEQVYSSGYVVADYISKKHPRAKVFCITLGGMKREMENVGVKVLEGKDGEKAEIVAVGLDLNLTYEKLATAFRAIQYNKAKFFASNKDHVYTLEDGLYPGGGTIVAALEFASRKKATDFGKPNTYMLDAVLKNNGLKKSEVLLVGDNYETDIAMAKRSSVKSVLVLSGITKEAEIRKMKKKDRPDYVIKSIEKLPLISLL